ncbi:hypothetical protein [Branchiibius sp. NY16-3462-2]|uniref:hypothetical protein n=1 Tax=Branchiibius sp. NY16-3462-2 TaxID=1807500 RepID=UPI00079BAA9A|nr:hypothetical protein [Branchiibius sp. NY16-3462-2]KYH46119.1 hypothetical protein AZH51_10790 [Branchiibius sp. NY16-3462-2]
MSVVDAAPDVRRISLSRWVPPLLGVLVYLGCFRASSAAGVDASDLLRCTAYWVLGVVVPGWLVLRTAIGPSVSWLAEICLGACTGLGLELASWMVLSLLGQQHLVRFWPLLALLVLVRASWRQRLRERPTGRIPLPWLIAMTVAVLVLIRIIFLRFLNYYGPPYDGRAMYPDMQWHMGLAAEATRSFPLMVPQAVAAGDLRYHWFVDAHVAIESLTTGTSVQLILAQLYILPLILLIVGMSATLAHVLSGRAWAGGLAGVLATATTNPTLWPNIYQGLAPFIAASPTQIYALPLSFFAIFAMTLLLRRQPGQGKAGGLWLIFGIAAFAICGAKASAPPVLLGGALAALTATILFRRRELVRTAAVISVVMAIVTVIATKFVSGGNTASGVQFMAALSRTPMYDVLVGYPQNYSEHAPVIPGLFRPWVLSGVLVFEFWRLAGLLAAVLLLFSALRRRPEAWLLVGCTAAALLGFLLVRQPGLSEVYFIRGVAPLGGVMVAWLLAEHLPGTKGNGSGARFVVPVVWVVTATVAILVAIGMTRTAHTPAPTTVAAVHHTIRQAALVTAAGIAVVAAVAAITWRLSARSVAQSAGVPMAVVAGALAGLLAAPVLSAPWAQATTGPSGPSKSPSTVATRAQATVGEWINENLPADAVLATNTHCRGKEQQVCSANQWWISGLGGRRVLVEGWSYETKSAAKRAFSNAFFDQDLLRRNQLVFTRADPSDLAWVRGQGVSYLVAVSTATEVSPRLAAETDMVFQDGAIRVFKLRPTG